MTDLDARRSRQRERVDPIEQRVFDAFSAKDVVVFRGLLSGFIDAFKKG